MPKPINKTSFWEKRINTAVKEQYSVYVANDTLWEQIYLAHRKIINKLISKDDYVLDAGCGYGRMCTIFKPDKYEGIDFVPKFIEMAREKYPDYSFEVMDITKLPYQDGQFEWAFCVSMKKMFIDNLGEKQWRKAEKELKRVAEKVLILEYTDYEEYEVI